MNSRPSFDPYCPSLLSGIERNSWHDPPPECGRTKNFHGNLPPNVIHRPSRENQTSWTHINKAISLLRREGPNYTSASFWQRVAPTAPFKDWYFRTETQPHWLGAPEGVKALVHIYFLRNFLPFTSLIKSWSTVSAYNSVSISTPWALAGPDG